MHDCTVRSVALVSHPTAPRPISLVALALTMGLAIAPPVQATALTSGDVLTGQDVTNATGTVRQYAPDGTFIQELDTTTPSGHETGMCFDGAGNLYTTNFLAHSISKFAPSGTLISATFIDVSPATPNSCVFDAGGHLYVGLSDADNTSGTGGGVLLKFDISGSPPFPRQAFNTAPESRGTDWIDLAADQCTMLYTSVGSSIKRFDVCANTQLPDYCTACGDGNGGSTPGPLLALRILIGGGVLVADSGSFTVGVVRRYDGNVVTGTGTHVGSYAAQNAFGSFCGESGTEPCFFPFALTLDPDGETFWTADFITSEVFRFGIDGPGTPSQASFCGASVCDFFHSITGLAVVGELTAAASPQATTSLTASISAADKIYDGDPGATINGCTLSPSPAPTDDVTCVTSGAAFNDANVGANKPVTATVSLTGSAASKYTLASTAAQTTARITPRPITATADAQSKTYGDADPALTYQVTSGSLAAGDAFSGALTRASGEVVGAYPIQQGTLALNSNYTVAFVGANLSITTRAVTVTADAKTKSYGDADPPLTYQITGGSLANGDAISGALTRSPGEPVGAYAIQQGSVALGSNYALTFVGASLTVSPRPAMVAPDAKAKTYGTADPPLTGSLSGFLAGDGVAATYSRTPGESVSGNPYTISATLNPAAVLTNYAIVYKTAALTITPATPVLTWADPAAVTYPTPLGETQLSATASVPGAFAYTPGEGTVLSVGNGQLLSVLFTPTDSSNFTTASAQVHINVLPAAAVVTMSCPNVSLIGAALTVSGSISPASTGAVIILYTSPSGATAFHTAQSTATGNYSDALTPNEYGPWTVRASWNGAQSDACPVVVYGKSTGGTFVIGDGNVVLGAGVDFWGSTWWNDNTWSGGANSNVASLRGFLGAVDLPGGCGGSWSMHPSSSKPPSSIPPYMAVVVSSTISKNGSAIAGDVVAEVIVRTDPGYGPSPSLNGTGTIVAVRCQK